MINIVNPSKGNSSLIIKNNFSYATYNHIVSSIRIIVKISPQGGEIQSYDISKSIHHSTDLVISIHLSKLAAPTFFLICS